MNIKIMQKFSQKLKISRIIHINHQLLVSKLGRELTLRSTELRRLSEVLVEGEEKALLMRAESLTGCRMDDEVEDGWNCCCCWVKSLFIMGYCCCCWIGCWAILICCCDWWAAMAAAVAASTWTVGGVDDDVITIEAGAVAGACCCVWGCCVCCCWPFSFPDKTCLRRSSNSRNSFVVLFGISPLPPWCCWPGVDEVAPPVVDAVAVLFICCCCCCCWLLFFIVVSFY